MNNNGIDEQLRDVFHTTASSIAPAPDARASLHDALLRRNQPPARSVRALVTAGVTAAVVALVGGPTLVSRIRDGGGQSTARVATALGQPTDIAVPGAPVALAVSTASVWVALDETSTSNSRTGAVVRIDPTTGRVSGTTKVGGGVRDVAVGGGSIWTVNYDDSTVTRIAEVSTRVVATIAVPTSPYAIVVAGDAAWVTSGNMVSGELTKISLATNLVVSTTALPAMPVAIAYIQGQLWVASQGAHAIVRVDPATTAVVATTPLGADDAPIGLAVTGNEIAVAAENGRTLSLVDMTSGRVRRVEGLGLRASGVTAAGDVVYVVSSIDKKAVAVDARARAVAVPVTGPGAVDAATGFGDLWTANNEAGTVSRRPAG